MGTLIQHWLFCLNIQIRLLQKGRTVMFLSIKGKEVMGLENGNVPFTLDLVAYPVNTIERTNVN